ncbi:MAG: type II secretion system protein GspG [Phycisphaerales bacterium]|nr:MAG: type II secretion system protein GspG [Phycisphaerales bacterium]
MSRKRTPHRGPLGRSRRAFTLLEVIVVVTIIALLAALVAPKLLINVEKSKRKIAQADVSSIAQQVSLYLLDNGMSKPSDDLDLEMLVEGPEPYLRAKDLLDPWGNPYVIRTGIDAENPDFDIVSYAADGLPGGEGDGEDIVN